MYAVIESGGRQYKVAAGDEILLERMEGKPGKKVKLNEVMFLKQEKRAVSNPKDLARAKVTGVIVDQVKGKKLIVFKYKPKENYRRTKGHRQPLTRVRIEEIEFGGKKATAPKRKSKPAKKKVEAKEVTEKKLPKKEGKSKGAKEDKRSKRSKRSKKDQKKKKGKQDKKAIKSKASTKKSTAKETPNKKK